MVSVFKDASDTTTRLEFR